MAEPSGVVFPVSGEDGRRSSSALGRAVVADALRAADPVGARAAEHETSWRTNYLLHFRRLVEAGLQSPDAARRIATDGLGSLFERLRVRLPDGKELALAEAFPEGWPAGEPLATATVTGEAPPERELSLPYRGQRLRGEALLRQLDAWVEAGVIEPSCAEAVGRVVDNPAWLDLSDLRVVVLGAGAEMGPVHSLLRWGGEVVAVDLPRPAIWSRLRELASRYAGRLHVPVRGDQPGADLLHDAPAVADWLLGFGPDRRLVLGNYAYADGATHVRVVAACDALSRHLLGQRPDTALSFLATPTDVYAVPAAAVEHANRAFRGRSLLGRSARWLSAGRLLRRNYPPGADPGIIDCLVRQQGPNYALAKRIQRWRATATRAAGGTVSLTVAPMTRTRSVLRNRVLAAAYAGAHLFGVEVFDPPTSNTLMAALLVHDLRNPAPPREHPWRDEAANAAHGGVWRVAYAPRSALGLAAALGFGGARH
ncbi:MAG TPA: hypothetical protein VIL37_13650 [Natronosporangium sp.]